MAGEVLSTVPAATAVKSGVEAPGAVAAALGEALADTYALLLKTHAYHWNVEGPLFHSIHILTEAQYQDLFEATDVLAERIRALGQLAPMSPAGILHGRTRQKSPERPSAGEMVAELAADHDALASRMHDLFDLSEKHRDPVTADLATQRSAVHEKASWMLRALNA